MPDEDGNRSGGLPTDHSSFIVAERLDRESGEIAMLLLYYLTGVKGAGELVMAGLFVVAANVATDVTSLPGAWYVDTLSILVNARWVT